MRILELFRWTDKEEKRLKDLIERYPSEIGFYIDLLKYYIGKKNWGKAKKFYHENISMFEGDLESEELREEINELIAELRGK